MNETLSRLMTGALLHGAIKASIALENGSGVFTARLKEKGIIKGDIISEQIDGADGKETSLAHIIRAADGIAAAAERGEKGKGRSLLSLFNRLNADKETEEGANLYYRPLKLTNKINMPDKEAEPHDKKAFDEFLSVLDKKYKNIESSAQSVDLLAEILERYFIYVPSEEGSDISLYDRAKLTAALAACIYLYLNERGVDNYKAALSDNEKAFFKEKAFILYSIDLSGIQDFIYSITSKGALKALRARSFYLEILMENLVDTVLESARVSRVNCIYTGGGHAYMILPNTQNTKDAVADFEKSTNAGLLDLFGVSLYLAGGYAEFSADDISNNPPGSYKNVFGEVSEKISECKMRRYSAEEIRSLNSDVYELDKKSGKSDVERECAVCKRIDKLTEDNKCTICNAIEKFSKDILKEKEESSEPKNLFIVMNKSKDEKKSLPLPGGNYLYAATAEELNEIKNNPEKGYVRSYSKNDFALDNPGAASLWVGDYNDGDTFKDIADNAAGIRRLGVFRADIDNLGQAFVGGFKSEKFGEEYVALSRTAAFSRSLSLFFKAYINGILENGDRFLTKNTSSKKRSAAIVYSGGDDVFVIGAWDDIVGFAADLYNNFKEFTQGKLTISAGIGIYPEKYPVSAMAKETGKLEDKSKEYGFNKENEMPEKNAITLFDGNNTYSWKIFIEKVLDEKYKLIEEFFSDSFDEKSGYGKSFLYRLLELMKESGDKLNLARYAYLLARMQPDKEKLKSNQKLKERYAEFSKKMYEWIKDREDCRQAITAIYIYIYTIREREQNEKGKE